MLASIYIAMILLLPLLGGLLSYTIGKKGALKAYFIGPLLTLGTAVLILITVLENPIISRWEWLPGLELGWSIDSISAVLILLVAGISLLVHLFSAHYMSHEPAVHRYFGKLGFFTGSMMGLLVADHLLLLFIFWELVGFSSYLLIGFWFEDAKKSKAAREAFMINRVADAGLLVGVILLVGELGQPFISELVGGDSSTIMHLAGFCMMIGALGKSAQFPFFGWLPKAMAGPTPVSALIHAATMVAAGVYLLVRVVPILTLPVLAIVALLGALTAFMAAIAALTQFDIKKVLAYSTISQLGYMIMGIGVGAYESSLFHLWTHAFFKAGLFLGAGAVIHYLHELKKNDPSFDTQDMRTMGGLKSVMPITTWTFVICALALSGLPFFSGFLSKEGILTSAAIWADQGILWVMYLVPLSGLITAVLTPFYIGRQVLLVFFGKSRTELQPIPKMEPLVELALPLTVLAVSSIWIFHALSPLDAHGWWLSDVLFGAKTEHTSGGGLGLFVMLFSIIGAGLGLLLAHAKYKPSAKAMVAFETSESPQSALGALSWNAWFLEGAYDRVAKGYLKLCHVFAVFDKRVIDRSIDGLGVSTVVLSKALAILDREVVDGVVNFAAWLARRVGQALSKIQSGKVQNQIVWLMLILIIVILWIQF